MWTLIQWQGKNPQEITRNGIADDGKLENKKYIGVTSTVALFPFSRGETIII